MKRTASRRVPTHQCARGQAGFTLIEALVAFSVVAVLAALVLSGMRSMMAKSHNVKCVANLKSCGRAMLNYFQDNNGNFLPKKYWFQYSSYRPGNAGMREYFEVEADSDVITNQDLRVPTMLTCPGMLAIYPNLRKDAFQRGYSINYYLSRYGGDDNKTKVPSFDNMRSVPKLSELWMMTDGAVSGGADQYQVSGLLGSLNESAAYAAREFLPYPHAKRNNFVFFDGHVEGLSKQDLETKRNQSAFWGSTKMTQ